LPDDSSFLLAAFSEPQIFCLYLGCVSVDWKRAYVNHVICNARANAGRREREQAHAM